MTLPEADQTSEPPRVQFVDAGALIQPPAAPVEIEVVRRLEVNGEPRGQVALNLVSPRRQEIVPRFLGHVQFSLEVGGSRTGHDLFQQG